jgi:peptidyl-dipeptidase Dcp
MHNPLLSPFNTPFETVPFTDIESTHFLPAIKVSLEEARTEIANIRIKSEASTFDNTVEALENIGERLDIISSAFFNLNHAETSPELQQLAKEISPLLTQFSNDILLDNLLFKRIKEVYDQRKSLHLSKEEAMLLEKKYKSFVRNGANLDDNEKEELRAIDQELAQLSLQFGDNVLAETNSFQLIIEEEDDLDGLPEGIVEAAADLATQKGMNDKWIFTLAYPSYIPFMTYAQNRELRKQMSLAFASKCFKGNEFDNQDTVKRITSLRHRRANLLGYATHAHFVLEERMAQNPEKVKEFLKTLLEKAFPAAQRELDELKAYAQKLDGITDFQRWDFSYYSEKLKKEKFQIDDEILKPYFELNQVQTGIFEVARKLYGLQFIENNNISKYHPEVVTYEVRDRNDKHLAVFYADFFPRDGKKPGAWMTSFRGQKIKEGKNIRPHVSIVCNFSKPTSSKPSLLTLNEVLTFFHEFGHALHGMLADTNYESLSGTSVFWDFVELPSQIMENWVYEKETLDIFARHYHSEEVLPTELINKIKESSNFMEGYQTVRQLSFALLDMSWHGEDPTVISSVGDFEKECMRGTQLFPEVEDTNMSVSFAHIFQGGYSAGYYSYKWAEVLDADAFAYFQEKGIFNPEVAQSFQDNILSKGGSEPPMELYKRFRGKEPEPEALLRRGGLLQI